MTKSETVGTACCAYRGVPHGRGRSLWPYRSRAERTFDDWNDPPPGSMEMDLLAQCGEVNRGGYVQPLRSRTGTKLYAVRGAKGEFEDIQTYKRAQGQDERRVSKAETAASKKAGLPARKAKKKATKK